MTTKISEANIQTATLNNLAGGGPTIGSIIVTDNSYNNLDDTAVALEGGFVKLIGSKFAAGCQVLIGLTPATSVTFISETEVRAQLPATAAGTYIVYLVNPGGGTAIRVNAVTFSGTPTWVSGSALVGVVDTAISIQLSATGATTFAVAAGSTLPPGVSLSSLGLLSGTVTGITQETVYNFVINAIDAELQDSPRSFAFTVTSGDAFFAQTTLLLPGSATTFVRDASTNNFPVTVVGDTRPNTFNPYLTGWSNFFDGTGDSLFLPSTPGIFNFGTNDFTIEAWIYPTALSGFQQIAGASYSASGAALYLSGTTLTVYTTGTQSNLNKTPDGSILQNTWQHVAAVRSSGTLKLYINGIERSSVAYTTNLTTDDAAIGQRTASNAEYYFGYISNLRVVKGTAVYTSAFTPPTQPLTAIANTSLLTCQSNRLRDASTNNFAITRNGDVTVDSFSPFIEPATTRGSAYFDGTGDYLSVASAAGNALGAGDFTIQLWFFLSGTTGVGGSGEIGLIGCGNVTSSRYVIRCQGTGPRVMSWWLNTPSNNVAGSTAIALNTWYHVALVRNGSGTNNVKLYLNGVLESQGTSTYNSPADNISIGRGYPNLDSEYTNGYISNLQMVVGTALYTANFAPPTAPLTAIANTSLLTLQNNQPTNNSMFLDSSTENFLITRNGNTTQGTFSPYSPSGWSNFFDGGTNRLTTAGSAIFNLTGTSLTLECWVYMTAAPSVANRLITIGPNGSQSSLVFAITTSRVFDVGIPLGGTSNVNSGATLIPLNAWTHLAFVLSGSTGTIYINGTQVGQSSSWNITSSNTNYFYIGYDATATVDGKFTGYVSNVRLVKGSAVYTGAFTPPTRPLTAVTGTAILTCADNRIIDESPNNHAVTVVGGVRVQNWSPFKAVVQPPVTYSAYFDGTGDYLTIPTNTAFNIFGNDMTIECWFYANSFANSPHIFAFVQDSTNRESIYFTSSALTFFSSNASGSSNRNATGPLSINTWYHMALVKSGSTFTLYLNGTSTGTTSNTTQYSTSDQSLQIGTYNNGSFAGDNFNGYISNVRIVKGTAVYTTNFTPSTTPLTATTGTSLLTCQSATFVDNSTNQFVITAVGNSQPVTVNPFGSTFVDSTGYSAAEHSGSMYFDGTGDSLNISSNQLIHLSNQPFTIEAWVYPNANNGIIVGRRASVAARGFFLGFGGSGEVVNKFYFWAGDTDVNNWNVQLNSASTYPLNQWCHVAATRNSSNVFTLWINGVSQASATASFAIADDTSNLQIGIIDTAGSPFNGYISNLRIAKGAALYTSQFVPPLAPVQPTPNTVLLLNGTSAAITDATTKNVLETVGDVRVTTAISRTGGSSMLFDGTGDRLVIPDTPDINLGSGDFTLECWVYFNVVNVQVSIINKGWNSSSAFASYLIWMENSGSLRFNSSSNGSSWDIANERVIGTMTVGAWTHIAVTRSGTTFRAFVNGAINNAFTFTSSASLANIAAQTLFIGDRTNGGTSLNGYMQDVRITKGIARYTANFTPPTTAFQAR
jgi:hypothetical protein